MHITATERGISASGEATGKRRSTSVSDQNSGEFGQGITDFLFVDDVDEFSISSRDALLGVLKRREADGTESRTPTWIPRQASVLCTASPKHGRFDKYQLIGEQLRVDSKLLPHFDLIFPLTDSPDQEVDRDVAEHVIQRHFAGERYTNQSNLYASHVSQADVEEAAGGVAPPIEPDLLRKYIAFARHNCYPTMTDDAQVALCEFYLNLRARGRYEDAPVPVTAKRLEALVKLAEASARIRLSDTVTTEDTDRILDLVKTSLHQIGVDPETGEFDVDIIELETSKTQRDNLKNMQLIVEETDKKHDLGAPLEKVLDRAEEIDIDRSQAEEYLEELRRKGRVYQPRTDHFRAT